MIIFRKALSLSVEEGGQAPEFTHRHLSLIDERVFCLWLDLALSLTANVLSAAFSVWAILFPVFPYMAGC